MAKLPPIETRSKSITQRSGLLRVNSYAVIISIVCLSHAAWLANGQAAELSGTGPGGAPHTVQFDNLVIFGDSLSDVGNLYARDSFPPSPYWSGRFSNGPVWIEQLAADLGMPAPTPSKVGGNNFAWGGAQTGTGFSTVPVILSLVPNVSEQVQIYLATNVASPTALYVLWAGANDFFNGQTDPSIPADNIVAAVNTLETAGASNFLVLNLPPLGSTPKFLNTPGEAGISALADGFNTDLAAGLASLDGIGKTILLHDVYSDFTHIQANPSQYGLQNTTEQAMTTAGADASVFLFWDDVHPTTMGAGLVAASVLVPEPATLALLAFGCLAVMIIRRKKMLA
ncbi:MAG: SGNH/GDSL hydrolase family protein [Verrucomicrobiota bacterium]